MEEKRASLRLNVLIECKYTHEILKKGKSGEAVILNLSGNGCMMLTKEFLKSGKKVRIDISSPLELLELNAEVVSSKAEWYITDRGKEMYFTTRVKFTNTSPDQKRLIIKYIYKCQADLRKARFKKLGL